MMLNTENANRQKAGALRHAVLYAPFTVMLTLGSASATAASAHSGQASYSGACGTLSPIARSMGPRYFELSSGAHAGDLQGDTWWPFELSDIEELSALEPSGESDKARQFEHLLEKLHRSKFDHGEGTRTRCHGTGNRLHEVQWQFRLEDIERVQTLDGAFLLTAFEDRYQVQSQIDDHRSDDTVVAEVMSVPATHSWAADVLHDTLKSNHRFRRRGALRSPVVSSFTRPVGAAVDSTLANSADLIGDDLQFNDLLSPLSGSLLFDGLGSNATMTEVDLSIREVGNTIEIKQIIYIGGERSEWTTWRLRS